MIFRKAAVFMIVVAFSLPAAAEDWRAGVAKVVITPTELTWLSGYGERTKPAEGKVHDLYAKAIAIEDKAGTRLVIVTLDLGSVNVHTTDFVAEQAEKRFGLHRANLVLNCSHTHVLPKYLPSGACFSTFPSKSMKSSTSYIERTES